MKIILDIGDRVKVRDTFDSENYANEIRALANQFVTIRKICGDRGYYIKETEGMECDDVWDIDDFEL